MERSPGIALELTARWAAAVRAMESERPDRLFTDPWAARLAGEEGATWAADRPADRLVTMVLRTRFYDDFLQRVTRADDIGQVVLLAAGLDTRAFRLDWPEAAVVYELDQREVLESKDGTLHVAGARPRADRRVCPTDLRTPGWVDDLAEAGFDRHVPAVFLAEGFSFYLPAPAVLTLLEQVTDCAAPGSALGVDVVNTHVLTHPLTRPWVEMQAAAGAPWIGTFDDPVAVLDRLGWRAELSQCGAPDAHYGRWPYPQIPISAPDLPHHWLVTARRPS
jgi:methyltransferase (TIGR00027 family)